MMNLYNLSRLLYLSVFCSSLWTAVANPKPGTDEYHAEALIKWLKEENGYFNPALEMRRMDPNDPTSFFGMFVNTDIDEDETLLRIPTSMIIKGPEERLYEPMECGTVNTLISEMKLGDKSKYAPYVNYLKDTQPPGQLPSAWSKAGKDLLLRVLKLGKNEEQVLPPYVPTTWIEDEWVGKCKGVDDEISNYSALIVIQRAWDDLLIPVFDMMSHRNGDWLNTKSTPVHEDDGPVEVKASRDIKAGEQIYTSYNFCEDCGNRVHTYGTPDILRDYGFVEQFPQRWVFSDWEVSFVIDEVYDNNDTFTGEYDLFGWIKKEPAEEDMEELRDVLEELKETIINELKVQDSDVPENEWNMIRTYANAMELALRLAVDGYFNEEFDYGIVDDGVDYDSSDDEDDEDDEEEDNQEELEHDDEEVDEDEDDDEEMEDEEEENQDELEHDDDDDDGEDEDEDDDDYDDEEIEDEVEYDEEEDDVEIEENNNEDHTKDEEEKQQDEMICNEDGKCVISTNSYHDLEEYHERYSDDDFGTDLVCDTDQVISVMNSDFESTDEIVSQYQNIYFTWNPENNDACMDIESTIQICTSYRPHYHEMSVHYPARYLPDVKRFVWVGGGDSMLLHEFLKYPNLELAVGLELDQRVTRGSFKHFGTQPHFDNEKVEWWFGDATKSLVMLPKEYFGSFDMVIVDLSETVMSFAVTEELDIFEALTLLLKPDGIFVKNEIYFDKFRSMFPYSMGIHWYDNPVVCGQSMIFGSRAVDFINTYPFDHNVETLFLESYSEIEDPYELIHDYSKNNVTTTKMCDSLKADSNRGLTKQDTSPGILMIVEAENTSVDLTDLASLMDTLKNTLEHAGFSVVSVVPNTASGNDVIVSIIMKEGYVMARTMPEYKYCGFDIHLWSSFEKQVAAKKALLSAVGSKDQSPSSFRIIAGGMYGVSTWKEDKQQIGPHYDAVCTDTVKDTVATTESSTVNADDSEMMSQFVIDAVIVESVKMVSDKGVRVALLCGDDVMTCEGNRKAMLSNKGIKDVMTLSCPMMNDFNPYTSEAAQLMHDCREYLQKSMEDYTKKGDKFDAIVLDSSVDKFIGSVMLKLFTNLGDSFYDEVMMDDSIVVSASGKDCKICENFVMLFKSEVYIYEPAFYTKVSLMDGDRVMNLYLSMYNDEEFIKLLKSTLVKLKESYRLEYKIHHIHDGLWNYHEDFEPSVSFSPEDYDSTGPLENWESQNALGHQIIFQMFGKKERLPGDIELSSSILRKALEKALVETSPALPSFDKEALHMEESTGLGDGSVVVALWSGGSVVMLWDGREHVDVNMFTYEEDRTKANDFESKFRTALGLTTMLRDEQPRGVGRVVSYQSDIKEIAIPRWV